MLSAASRRWPVALLSAILIAWFSIPVMAGLGSLDAWRTQARQVRMLAENDAPTAYRKAKHLQSTLPADAAPADRAQVLNLLSRIEIYLGLTNRAATHLQQAFDLAKLHADRVGQAEAYLNIALNAVSQGQVDAMTTAITNSMEILDGVNRPDLLSEAMLRAVVMYRQQGQLDDSFTTAMHAMEIARSSDDPVALIYAHYGLALSFSQNGQLKEARDHYMQMREQARAAHLRRMEADSNIGLGRVTSLLGDMQGGERFTFEAVNTYREVGTPFGVAYGLFALAESLHHQGHTTTSLPVIDEVVTIYEKYPNKIGLWWALNARSMYKQSLHQANAARVDAKRAYALARGIGVPLYLSESAKRMAAIAQAVGDYPRAYKLLVEANATSNQAVQENAGKYMLALIKRYESKSRQRQIDALNLRNERQTAELHQHALYQRWLITLASSCLIVLVVTAFLLLRLRRSNRMLKEEAAERMRIDEALLQSEYQFRTLVENTHDHIARYDKNRRRVYANPRMVADYGMSLEQILNKTPMETPGGESYLAYEERLNHVLVTATSEQYELNVKSDDGRSVVRLIRLTPEFNQEGEVVSVLAVGRDITEIDAYRKQIYTLAFFDRLTFLPNRSLLCDRIGQTVAVASWLGRQFGLMMMDLDHFKEINDTLGHSVGDQLLREAAERIQSCVRSSDTVARLGGDEFAALLPDIHNSNSLAAIAHKILNAFNKPFIIERSELFISVSIGIALYPGDSTNVETLFRYADSAMYHAKRQGRNNFQFYSADLTENATSRMSLENDLRKALERDELELYYQPQVELKSGKIIGAEALLRWFHRDKGMITPDKFIPVAEETGLIVGIGEWVLLSACQAAVAWNTNRLDPLRIAVNISTRQFIRHDLVSAVRRILQETACDPAWLKLEITESLLLEDNKEIAAMLETLNSMGLAISIDDFGTGYSALGYLNRFPVSQIKIDHSFVQGIPNDRDKTGLVKAMISIAQTLHLELVAEGIETREQADCLLAEGCNLAQGYLFGKPMPHAEFEKIIMNSPGEPHGILQMDIFAASTVLPTQNNIN